MYFMISSTETFGILNVFYNKLRYKRMFEIEMNFPERYLYVQVNAMCSKKS